MLLDPGSDWRDWGRVQRSGHHRGLDTRGLGRLAVRRRPARPQGVPQLRQGRQRHLHLGRGERLQPRYAGLRGQARHPQVGAGPGGGGGGGWGVGGGHQDEDRPELPRYGSRTRGVRYKVL